jgi:GH15 family glucan-1,4-alpha-glucosidase
MPIDRRIHDGAFSVFALLGLGFTEEATAFGEWLCARVDEHAGDASRPLKIMYRIDGSSELTEETLDHLDGYMGSRPVRIGNGASDQLQLDISAPAIPSM